jgi:hypothetical protein
VFQLLRLLEAQRAHSYRLTISTPATCASCDEN